MDDIVLCNKSNEVPRCFKHNSSWQSRVQEIMNKLRDKYLKKVYMLRFNKLLCTCEGLEYANLWEDVTDEELNHSVKFIDDYVSSNTNGGELYKILSTSMDRLRYDGELYEVDYESPVPGPYPRASALKFCYLLQKIVEKDFAMMEPRKPKGVPQARAKQKVEMPWRIDLDEITVPFIPHLIGEGGKNIMIFMKRERCRVEIGKVENENKVEATVTKTIMPENRAVLKEIAERLKIFAKDTKESYESFENDPEDMDTDQTSEATTSQTVIGASGGTPVAGNTYNSIEQPILSSAVSTISQGVSLAVAAGASPSSSVGVSSTVSSVVGNSAEDTKPPITTNQMSGGLSLVNHTVDVKNAGNQPDPCPTSCLIHDRRWLSTYQYVLTQCYKHIRLPRNLGSRFSRLVCTCSKDRPEARLYFIKEDEMVDGFEKCKRSLLSWPQECQPIIRPLIGQLEKYDRSDIWHSLFKFVFYFHGLSGGNTAMMEMDYKLPGHCTTIEPRPEKPYLYQVNFKPTGSPPASADSGISSSASGGGSSPGASPGTSNNIGTSPGTSSNIGTSLGLGSRTSLIAVAGSDVGDDSCSRNTSSESCSGACGSSRDTTPVGAGSTRSDQRKLKRVHPDEWSDDCFFHGKKKKSAFQCVINHLHTKALLPAKLNVPFSLAVCVCNERVEFEQYYQSKSDLKTECRNMKIKLQVWRGVSKVTVLPFINLLDEYMRNETISDGFLKFVYYFNKVVSKDYIRLNEIYDLVKQKHNK